MPPPLSPESCQTLLTTLSTWTPTLTNYNDWRTVPNAPDAGADAAAVSLRQATSTEWRAAQDCFRHYTNNRLDAGVVIPPEVIYMAENIFYARLGCRIDGAETILDTYDNMESVADECPLPRQGGRFMRIAANNYAPFSRFIHWVASQPGAFVEPGPEPQPEPIPEPTPEAGPEAGIDESDISQTNTPSSRTPDAPTPSDAGATTIDATADVSTDDSLEASLGAFTDASVDATTPDIPVDASSDARDIDAPRTGGGAGIAPGHDWWQGAINFIDRNKVPIAVAALVISITGIIAILRRARSVPRTDLPLPPPTVTTPNYTPIAVRTGQILNGNIITPSVNGLRSVIDLLENRTTQIPNTRNFTLNEHYSASLRRELITILSKLDNEQIPQLERENFLGDLNQLRAEIARGNTEERARTTQFTEQQKNEALRLARQLFDKLERYQDYLRKNRQDPPQDPPTPPPTGGAAIPNVRSAVRRRTDGLIVVEDDEILNASRAINTGNSGRIPIHLPAPHGSAHMQGLYGDHPPRPHSSYFDFLPHGMYVFFVSAEESFAESFAGAWRFAL